MNLTLKTVPKIVPLSDLKAGDVFDLKGSKFVKLRQYSTLEVVENWRLNFTGSGLKFVYTALPGDSMPFTIFASNEDYQVEHLGTLVNADEQIKNQS